LFGRELGGQTSWLLPLAALGCLAAAWQTRPGRRSPRHQALLFWALWLIPQLAFFSIANLFHRYYLEMLAPAIAALAGAGLVALWDDYRSPGWRGWLLPIALLATAALHLYLLHPFPDWDRRLSPIIVAATAVAAAALAGLRLAHWDRKRPWQVALAALGVGALLLAPAVWGALPVWQGGNVMLPAAGPEGAVQRRGPAGAPRADRLTTYLLANRQGASFLAATFSANVAAPFILATGQPVMAMGGFSGGDRILTVQDLERMVRDRQVRFFVFEGNQQPDLERWIESRCRAVPPNLWQGGQAQPGLATPGNVRGLYDCGNMGQ
jgi:4-amino-4-deoxy-L-arabinose transferase-like glycosyltransferase